MLLPAPRILAPLEYVIIRTLEYFRVGGSQKHLRDIRSMLMIEGDGIDFSALRGKIAQLGLESVSAEVQPPSENPETP